eukprot:TRINITY_DN6545_c0_g2_i1.p1 TRINITY_DN6545_c0_g2~~TRINITY_DN6545_c0_g2_i1.p1  ORF type:complete len:313 (+),score=59.44 TRINITY_DN6545_c0_g2_i1:65-1003(+)
MSISRVEEDFIAGGVEMNVRDDGRGRLEERHLSVQTGFMENCYGSSRVKIGQTEVMCCVNAEIAQTDNKQGKISVNVNCTPGSVSTSNMNSFGTRMALKSFTGILAHRTRCILNTEQQPDSDRFAEIPATTKEAASQQTRKQGIDLRTLYIRDDKCWGLYCDVTVLANDGNCLTATTIAVRSALLSTRLPKVIIHEDIEGDEGIEISGNSEDAHEIPGARENLPICVTVAKLGSHLIVDPTLSEESFPLATYHIGVTPNLSICSITTSLSSGANNPSMHTKPADVCNIIEMAGGIARTMFSSIDEQLKDDEE